MAFFITSALKSIDRIAESIPTPDSKGEFNSKERRAHVRGQPDIILEEFTSDGEEI